MALAMTDRPGNPEAVDLAAFERIILEHERRVYLTALHLLGGRADAQDAAQEVWLRVHRGLKRIDPERDLAPWLYRVTVNVCRDIGRRRSRTEPLEDVAAGGSAEDDARREEQRRMLTVP